MQRMTQILAIALLALACAGAPALAHPHVYVTMKSEIVYDAEGRVTGIRHAWTFDDMFSAYATQGLESKEKGVFTREELKELAEVNVTSMKELDFFSQAKLNGKKAEFDAPVDYWLDFKDSLLTLNFTLPVKGPVKTQDLALEIYDPVYFVSFSFADKDPVAMAGAPAKCKLTVFNPDAAASGASKPLSESFFNKLDANAAFGAQFANKISVKCP